MSTVTSPGYGVNENDIVINTVLIGRDAKRSPTHGEREQYVEQHQCLRVDGDAVLYAGWLLLQKSKCTTRNLGRDNRARAPRVRNQSGDKVLPSVTSVLEPRCSAM